METINLDTSILIEHYRIKDKNQSRFYKLSKKYNFVISSIVKYEIMCGDKKKDKYWQQLFAQFDILTFDSDCASIAADIYIELKHQNKLINIDDILIAAISIKNKTKLATLNIDHFKRIEHLELI